MAKSGKPIYIFQPQTIPPAIELRVDMADISGEVIADKLSISLANDMQEHLNRSIFRIMKLNTMSDEEIIQEILKDQSVYELLTSPSDVVTKAYEFKYIL